MRGPITIPLAMHRAVHVVEGAIDANVAHSREPSQQCNACVGDNRVALSAADFAARGAVPASPMVGQMRVTIDQSRQHVILEGSITVAAGRNGQISHPSGFDLPAAHHERLIRQHPARVYIHKFSRTNHSNLHRRSSLLGRGKRCKNRAAAQKHLRVA